MSDDLDKLSDELTQVIKEYNLLEYSGKITFIDKLNKDLLFILGLMMIEVEENKKC